MQDESRFTRANREEPEVSQDALGVLIEDISTNRKEGTGSVSDPVLFCPDGCVLWTFHI
jgi:hypothetical protein